jgi:hypothetical protein
MKERKGKERKGNEIPHACPLPMQAVVRQLLVTPWRHEAKRDETNRMESFAVASCLCVFVSSLILALVSLLEGSWCSSLSAFCSLVSSQASTPRSLSRPSQWPVFLMASLQGGNAPKHIICRPGSEGYLIPKRR